MTTIDELISKAVKFKISASDDSELEQGKSRREKLEREIHNNLFRGEKASRPVSHKGVRVSPEVIDYCFVNFPCTFHNINNETSYSAPALDYSRSVTELIKDTKKFAKQQIVVVNSGVPSVRAIIEGPAYVNIHQMGDCYHRELIVPVSTHLNYKDGKWELDERSKGIEFDKHLFFPVSPTRTRPLGNLRSFAEFGNPWRAYSEDLVFGGTRGVHVTDVTYYLGNDLSNQFLESFKNPTKHRIPLPRGIRLS
jgi:hypothetical protein